MEADLTSKGGSEAGDPNLLVRLQVRVQAARVLVQVEGAARVSLHKEVVPLRQDYSLLTLQVDFP